MIFSHCWKNKRPRLFIYWTVTSSTSARRWAPRLWLMRAWVPLLAIELPDRVTVISTGWSLAFINWHPNHTSSFSNTDGQDWLALWRGSSTHYLNLSVGDPDVVTSAQIIIWKNPCLGKHWLPTSVLGESSKQAQIRAQIQKNHLLSSTRDMRPGPLLSERYKEFLVYEMPECDP